MWGGAAQDLVVEARVRALTKLIPVRRQTAETSASLLLRSTMMRYGVPGWLCRRDDGRLACASRKGPGDPFPSRRWWDLQAGGGHFLIGLGLVMQPRA